MTGLECAISNGPGHVCRMQRGRRAHLRPLHVIRTQGDIALSRASWSLITLWYYIGGGKEMVNPWNHFTGDLRGFYY